MERQEHGIARHVRLAHEAIHDAARAHERRARKTHRHPRSVEDDREAEWRSEAKGRYGGRPALAGHRHARLAAGRRDQYDLLRRERCDGHEHDTQQHAHVRFPLTPRASSRSATRRFSSSRLSCCFLALASAIATLAIPSLKYSSSGTMVSPLRLVPPMSLRISCACSSSLRERAGGGLL